jgi:hypothetical protein
MAEGWQVLNQEQVIAKLPDNTYGPVVRVTFRTDAGVVRNIDVPVAAYDADTVRATIDAEVVKINEIANL